MSTPLSAYLENRNENAIPAKGALPDTREWVDFAEFELKGNRLCVCDSWCPYDGVMVEMPPGKYAVKALCYTYGGDVRVAALRIARPDTNGEPGEAVGEFGVDVGAVGITDIDLVETLGDDGYQDWMESYSCADSHPPAGRHLCPEAGTEMLFTDSGWGDGWYTVRALTQDGQKVGVETRFIEQEDERYPFDRDDKEPAPPVPEEIAQIDKIIAAGKEIALATAPIDREPCIAAFTALYAAKNLPAPEFVFCTSLKDMRDRARAMIPKNGDLEDVVGEKMTLIEGLARHPGAVISEQDEGIVAYIGNASMHFRDIDNSESEAEDRAAAAMEIDIWDDTYGMAVTTWGEFSLIVIRLGLETLGLREPDEKFHIEAHALSTCGGAGCYERYCFISDRPAQIAYPGITPGAAAGRCRIEWRDGFVCDEALDD